MKKILLVVLMSVFMMSAHAQQLLLINNVQVLPSNPSSTDTLLLIITCTFSSGACSMQSSVINVNGGLVSVDANYCPGMLTVICTSTDTVIINPLPAGSYTISVTVNVGAAPNCNPVTPAGNSSVNITVSGAAGFAQALNPGDDFLLAASEGNLVYHCSDLSFSGLIIRSADGRTVYRKKFNSLYTTFHIPLAGGIYFYGAEGMNSRFKKLIIP